jgi:hypothetical protein
MSTVSVKVFEKELSISPSSYTVKMNASSIYTKNVTVSTTKTTDVTVEIKVLPGDYSTAESWGTDFIAFADPSKVTVSLGNDSKVTIIHYGEKTGNYKVKVIAAK